jgi:L-amino acid N-acyltransferase YncA
MIIRPATRADDDGIWAVLEPTIRAGETFALPRGMRRNAALGYWFESGREIFVAEGNNVVLGTYKLGPNQLGGGKHVANAAYVTAPIATGQGIARAMCNHSLDHARAKGYRAMQFNFVISTNDRAVRLWHDLGFVTVGRLPSAFFHPTWGYVDVFVLFRAL